MRSPTVVKALGDNLVYVLEYEPGKVLIVDPGQASAANRTFKDRGLELTHVLCTHHHHDHIGGVEQLRRTSKCHVVAADARRIKGADIVVEDGDILTLGGVQIKAIATPGHTMTSVCYHLSDDDSKQMLFTGDTLFIGGCGRLFECDAETMWTSLQRLAALPEDTLVYCGHEYTIENYEFALQIEPNNQTVRDRLEQLRAMLQRTGHTVPSTIAQECRTNCFLRSDTAEVRTALNMPDAPAAQVFAELRSRKNYF
jgi:hydroxyacylglutathione hydrolase